LTYKVKTYERLPTVSRLRGRFLIVKSKRASVCLRSAA